MQPSKPRSRPITKAGLPSIDVHAAAGQVSRLAGAHLRRAAQSSKSAHWAATAPSGWPAPCPTAAQSSRSNSSRITPKIARANFEAAGLADRVEIRVGRGRDIAAAPCRQAAGRPSTSSSSTPTSRASPTICDWSLKLSRPGTVIIADNVVRDGKILNANSRDPHVRGVQQFLELVAANPRLSATAMPTVGARGYDGFAMALVLQ